MELGARPGADAKPGAAPGLALRCARVPLVHPPPSPSPGWRLPTRPPPASLVAGQVAALVFFINPQVPQACTALYPGDPWKCVWGSYRLPLLQTPYFLVASQFDRRGRNAPRPQKPSCGRRPCAAVRPCDSFEIAYDTDNYSPATEQQCKFVNSFQAAVLDLFGVLPSGTSIFSSTCYVHCLSGQATWYQFQVNGMTMAGAVDNFFWKKEETKIISTCRGWQCTFQCGYNTATGLPCNIGDATCCLVRPRAAAKHASRRRKPLTARHARVPRSLLRRPKAAWRHKATIRTRCGESSLPPRLPPAHRLRAPPSACGSAAGARERGVDRAFRQDVSTIKSCVPQAEVSQLDKCTAFDLVSSEQVRSPTAPPGAAPPRRCAEPIRGRVPIP